MLITSSFYFPGKNGNLALRVTPYRPNVVCFAPGSGPPRLTCRVIIDDMPVGGKQQRFGPATDPEATVVIPWEFTTIARRCGIIIASVVKDASDTSDWYKLWAAANAVDYMCIRRGMGGIATGHGNAIFISVFRLLPWAKMKTDALISIRPQS